MGTATAATKTDDIEPSSEQVAPALAAVPAFSLPGDDHATGAKTPTVTEAADAESATAGAVEAKPAANDQPAQEVVPAKGERRQRGSASRLLWALGVLFSATVATVVLMAGGIPPRRE